jgi:peroxiredoxin
MVTVLVAGCAGGLVSEPSGGSTIPTEPVEGALAPNLMLSDLNGDVISLSDLRGRPVLLNFWTTWCAFCRAERETLQQAHEEYGDKGLAVLAVAIGEDPTLLRNFVEEQGLTYAILLDEDGRASRLYRVRGIPASFFIDRQGVIQVQHVGALAEELLTEYVEKLQ